MVRTLRFVPFFLILFFPKSYSQDVIISNSIISTCGGNFYDSGVDTSTYSINENYTMTLCSDVPGQCVSLQFTQFSLENNFDFLYAYNGPSASSPLIGTYTGNISPGTITATSGCITIRFVSDHTVNKNGWAAIINCAACPVNGCPTCIGGLPPSNDDCIGAQNLGAMPAPAPCPGGQGQTVTFNTSNICATADFPYNGLQACDPVGNMASPASDVWYKFTITAPILNVTINGMITPEVGLYSGTGCNNLVPRGCAIGGGGLLNTSFSGLAPGTYYLRVSGGTLNDQCNFALSLQNNSDCQGCVIQSNLTVTPPPQNGIYLAGQSVQFCLNITGFNPSSANWLHAVIPTFGSGWDVSTLTFAPPVSCSGNGFWNWYNQLITSSGNSGFTTGPGFFYETSAGNPGGVADANPGNNFGDNISGGCSLNFCFTLQTKAQANCIHGEDLNIFIDTYGDGETGAWTSLACNADPVNDFYANIACCIPPAVAVTNPLCNGQTGSVTGTGLGSGPWDFVWKNSSGITIKQTLNAGNDILAGILPGQYTLLTTDVNGCESQTVFVVIEPQVLTANLVVSDTKCATNNGSITITASGGTAPYIYSANNGGVFQAQNIFKYLSPGSYDIVVKDANGCIFTTTVTVAPSTLPVINNIVTQAVTCYNGSDGSITITASSGIAPYSYSINNGNSFQASNLFTDLFSDIYQVVVSDVNGCSTQTNVQVNQPPMVDLDVLTLPANCGSNDGTITVNVISGGVGSLLYSINGGLNYQPSNFFSSLGPGVYTVVIQDANGCLAYDTAIVNNLNAPVLSSVVYTSLSCYHSNNGTITITASGGAGALQYSINNGVTFVATGTFTNLIAGVYKIVVKDVNNCRASTVVTLTEPPPLIIRADKAETECGMANGSLDINPENGVPPFQYSIDGGVTFQSSPWFPGLAAGNYTVVVTDATGCSSTRSYVIGSSTPPSVSSFNITDATCFGAITGSVIVNSTGGTPPLRYSIDGGATFVTSNSFNGLAGGNYNVIIQDNGGCSTTTPFSIAKPPQVVLNTTLVNSSCGLNNGSITMVVAGGTPPYTYSSDGGLSFGAASVFSNLAAGNYKVVVMDDNGCVEASTVNILGAPGPRILTTTFNPQICDGISNAEISVNAVSGSGVLQYSADSGITFSANPLMQNLFGGIHYIYVEDANGCRDSDVVSIPILGNPQIISTASADLTCNGSGDGNITINASGGNGSLEYSINNGSVWFTSNNFSSLMPGTYYIVVQDTNNCRSRDTVVITQPPLINISSTTASEKCHRNDGEILIHATGGTPGYSFSIDNNPFIPDSIFSTLDSGMYHIVVADANGCMDSLNVNISFSPAPVFNSLVLADETCRNNDDGSITVNATGGSGSLTYSYDNGLTYQLANSIFGLASGNYIVWVQDSDNCRSDTLVAINQPAPFAFSFSSISANCNFSNGAITVNASGGTGALTYSINQVNFTSNPTFSNLASGNYIITVKDASGCIEDFVASVSNLNGPSIVSVAATDLLCNGDNIGAITINANGGSGNLSYSINNGSTFFSSGNFNSLAAGNYSIVVSDTAGCVATTAVQIIQPDPIIILPVVTNAACGQSNGAVTLNASGGTGILQYSIDSITYQLSGAFNNLFAGSYNFVVHDDNNCITAITSTVNNLLAPVINSVTAKNLSCWKNNTGEITILATGGTGLLSYSVDNGSSFQSSNIFNSLAAGNYFITVSDINNCLANSTVIISEPDSLQLNPSAVNETCSNSNGSISIVASGGSSPYIYSSDSGIVFTSVMNYYSLQAGAYNMVIKDANGCKTYQTIQLTDLSGPQISNIISTNIKCYGGNDGSIQLNSSGGNGTLFYTLNNDPPQTSALFNNLIQGNYVISVRDSNGCIDTVHVSLTQPSVFNSSENYINPKCFGSADGTITVNTTGGTQPHSIQWNTGSSDFVLSNLAQGNYYYTVTDFNQCTRTDSVVLTQPQLLVISHTATNASCAGSANASAIVNVSGGTTPYSYVWSPVSSNTNYATNLSAGNYMITVTDAHACSQIYSLTITDPTPVIANISGTNISCFGGNNGSVLASAAGGYAPYTFLWYGINITDSLATSLPVGSYTVLVTDANGCTTEVTATLISPLLITISGSAQNAACAGTSTGAVSLSIGGGVSPYSYVWSNASSQSYISGVAAGNYTCTITDDNGCQKQVTYIVGEPDPIVAAIVPADTICIGQQASLTCNVSGGNGGYIYTWNTGSHMQSIQVSPSQTSFYSIQVADSSGCLSNVDTSNVFVYPPLSAVVSAPDTICEGESVTLGVNPSGGNGGPYSYLWNPTGTSQQITVAPEITTVYTVSVSDNCTSLPASQSVEVVVHETPVVNFNAVPSDGCVPLTVNFVNLTSTPAGSVYQWNLGDGSISSLTVPQHIYTMPGNYSVSLLVTTPENCSSSITKDDFIKAYELPEAAFTPSPFSATILNPLISFVNQSYLATSWNWNFGDGKGASASFAPAYYYQDTGTYTVQLIVATEHLCYDTAYGEVVITGDYSLYIPNAFTPNNDGKNDAFNAIGYGIKEMQLTVYNRWGNKVFESDNNISWDGRDQKTKLVCPQGVYIYMLSTRDIFNSPHRYEGRVSLVR